MQDSVMRCVFFGAGMFSGVICGMFIAALCVAASKSSESQQKDDLYMDEESNDIEDDDNKEMYE